MELILVLGIPLVLFALVIWLVLRSSRRWQLPPASSPETKIAQARLWSAKGSGDGN